MTPDAIPVRALASGVTLPPDAVASLFGAGAVLRPTARVALVRSGAELARVAVRPGAALAVALDRTEAVDGAIRVQGPIGATEPVEPVAVRSRLVLPDGLRRAWNVPDRATLALGTLALAVPVESGPEAVAEIERAVWLGAGRPDAARWLPGVALAEPTRPAPDDGDLRVRRRVVTETDVRQARLAHRRIRLAEGQIVTPAARSLAREWDVFADGPQRSSEAP